MIIFQKSCCKFAVAVLLLLGGAAFGFSQGISSSPEQEVVRFGLTPVVLHGQEQNDEGLAVYLSRVLKKKVEVVQRHTYQQIIDMLRAGQLDFAWICGLPYVRNSSWLGVTAIPENGFNDGRPFYRSLIIVAKDSDYKSLLDLKGKNYAFADPDSNSGHLVPRYLLHRMGTTADDFFSAHMFTYSHRNVIRAVAEGLVDAGSVDSYVYNMVANDEPELASKVRVLESSEEFAFPPIVHSRNISGNLLSLVRHALLNMPADEQGRELLRKLHLNGFELAETDLFMPIARMDREVFLPSASPAGKPNQEAGY